MDRNMQIREMTNDAKATLLLCGRFGNHDSARPLSLREYNRLTDWMQDQRIRPAELLASEASSHLQALPGDIDGERLKRLLGRGAAMALAVDKWSGSGIWVVCRGDEDYPVRLKNHLKKQAPPVLYGAGRIDLLRGGGIAVVGSRNVDKAGEDFTRRAVAACTRQGIAIVSGGARGVDQVAMLEGLHTGGTVIGALADSLLKAAVAKKYRNGLREQRMVLVSAFSPESRFQVGNAMGRNKHIYALADYGLVISAEKGKGGTWAGATEELKRECARPVFVRLAPDAPPGNRALIDLGARPFPEPPWGAELPEKLKAEPGKKAQRPKTQLLPFGNQLDPITTGAAVKEEPEEYGAVKTEAPETEPAAASEEIQFNDRVFHAVLPVLLEAASDWQTPKALVEILGVRKGQLDDWLKRALEEGRMEKRNRPVRYRKREQ
jgi:predicted Rossmann fold nucleotide-binding protein DprA/Smf involved in DNA uptake